MTEGKITGKIWHEDKDNHLTHILVFKDDDLIKHMKTDKLEYTINGLEAGEKYYLIMGIPLTTYYTGQVVRFTHFFQ
jgi:hypothetical protein